MSDQLCSNLQTTNTTFTWTINNFQSYCKMKPGEKLISPEIITNHVSGVSKWYSYLYPNNRKEEDGSDHAGTDYVVAGLKLLSSPQKLQNVSLSIRIINHKIETANIANESMTFIELAPRVGVKDWRKKTDLFSGKNNQFSKDETLTVLLGIDFDVSTNATSLSKSPECILSENLLSLFGNNDFCDVTLVVGEQKFEVHKAILSARSPVFAAMFQHDMKENNDNLVNIEDAKPCIFEEMLRYIYSSKVTITKENVMDLIRLADKYQLEQLKCLCDDVIIDTITLENALESLIIADLYSPISLKPSVLKYIREHITELVETEKFISMRTTHPQLIIDLLLFTNEVKRRD